MICDAMGCALCVCVCFVVWWRVGVDRMIVDAQLLRQILQVTGEKEREGDLAGTVSVPPNKSFTCADSVVLRALGAVRRALMVADPEKKARMLGQAIDLYDKSKNGAFQKECCNDEVRLLRLQMDLETSSQEGERFVGLSVGETLKALIESGQEKKADNLGVCIC